MIQNNDWVLLNLFNPLLVLVFICTTLLLEGLLLNYFLKKPLVAISLTVIANLGSFLVGLPMSNFQYIITNQQYVATSVSLYHSIISHLSDAFTFNISPFLFLDLIFFAGILSISTYLEFFLIKPFLLKNKSINLQTIFQVNLISHGIFIGAFFVLGFIDAVSIVPLEVLFVERTIVSYSTFNFMFVGPYMLIMVIAGVGGFAYLLRLIIDDPVQQ